MQTIEVPQAVRALVERELSGPSKDYVQALFDEANEKCQSEHPSKHSEGWSEDVSRVFYKAYSKPTSQPNDLLAIGCLLQPSLEAYRLVEFMQLLKRAALQKRIQAQYQESRALLAYAIDYQAPWLTPCDYGAIADIARSYLHEDNVKLAKICADTAYGVLTAFQRKEYGAPLLILQGICEVKSGKPEQGEKILTKALKLVTKYWHDHSADALTGLAMASLATGKLDQAKDRSLEAIERRRKHNVGYPGLTDDLMLLAQIHAAAANDEDQIKALEEVISIWTNLGLSEHPSAMKCIKQVELLKQ